MSKITLEKDKWYHIVLSQEGAFVNDEKIIVTTKNGNAVVVNEEYLKKAVIKIKL